MNRRSKKIEGLVKFPVNSKQYLCSGEGGMFVKLVALLENRDRSQCCGAQVIELLNECLVGCDVNHGADFRDRHYPHRNSTDYTNLSQFASSQYRFSIVLGSTGWSGWNGNNYWTCTYKDLTAGGKRLYDLLEKLFPKLKLELITFLDT